MYLCMYCTCTFNDEDVFTNFPNNWASYSVHVQVSLFLVHNCTDLRRCQANSGRAWEIWGHTWRSWSWRYSTCTCIYNIALLLCEYHYSLAVSVRRLGVKYMYMYTCSCLSSSTTSTCTNSWFMYFKHNFKYSASILLSISGLILFFCTCALYSFFTLVWNRTFVDTLKFSKALYCILLDFCWYTCAVVLHFFLHLSVSGSSSGSSAIQQGDMVEVCDGSLANLQGKVLSVTGDSAIIMPKHEDLTVSDPTRDVFILVH